VRVLTLKHNDNAQHVNEAANKLMDSFFALTNESLREVQTSAMMTEAENSVQTIQIQQPGKEFEDITNGKLVGNKRRKVGEIDIIVRKENTVTSGYDSAGDEGTIASKRNLMNQTGLMSKK
jgi:hypothetical protein